MSPASVIPVKNSGVQFPHFLLEVDFRNGKVVLNWILISQKKILVDFEVNYGALVKSVPG